MVTLGGVREGFIGNLDGSELVWVAALVWMFSGDEGAVGSTNLRERGGSGDEKGD
jgi:hypothetical protein